MKFRKYHKLGKYHAMKHENISFRKYQEIWKLENIMKFEKYYDI